jgi:hypothetical protein
MAGLGIEYIRTSKGICVPAYGFSWTSTKRIQNVGKDVLDGGGAIPITQACEADPAGKVIYRGLSKMPRRGFSSGVAARELLST